MFARSSIALLTNLARPILIVLPSRGVARVVAIIALVAIPIRLLFPLVSISRGSSLAIITRLTISLAYSPFCCLQLLMPDNSCNYRSSRKPDLARIA